MRIILSVEECEQFTRHAVIYGRPALPTLGQRYRIAVATDIRKTFAAARRAQATADRMEVCRLACRAWYAALREGDDAAREAAAAGMRAAGLTDMMESGSFTP